MRIIAVLMLAGCTDGADAAKRDAGSGNKPPCVKRNDHYALTATFEDIEPSKAALPECVRTCTSDPVSSPDGYDLISSLPSGPCSSEPACRFQANAPCLCGGRGQTNGYECHCAQGRWSCGVSGRAAAACPRECAAGD